MADDNIQLSDRQLKVGYWYTRNRVVIRASILSVAFLALGILLFFNLKNIFDFYVYDEIGTIQRGIVRLNVVGGIGSRNYTDPLLVGRSALVARSQNTFDFVAEVTNPNRTYALKSASVVFALPGWVSEPKEISLLPGERKWVLLSAVQDSSLSQYNLESVKPSVLIGSTIWQRIKDQTKYDQYGNFMGPQLLATNEKTSRPLPNVREFSFDVTNASVYNYRTIEAQVLLFNTDEIVAVNALAVHTIRAGQSRDVSVRWFYPIPSVTDWDVVLTTDLLDDDNFLPYTIEQIDE